MVSRKDAFTRILQQNVSKIIQNDTDLVLGRLDKFYSSDVARNAFSVPFLESGSYRVNTSGEQFRTDIFSESGSLVSSYDAPNKKLATAFGETFISGGVHPSLHKRI